MKDVQQVIIFKHLTKGLKQMKTSSAIALVFFSAAPLLAQAQGLTVSNINNQAVTKGQMAAQYQTTITSPAKTKDLRGVENVLVVKYIVPDGAIPYDTDANKSLASSTVRLVNVAVESNVVSINKICAQQQSGDDLASMNVCMGKIIKSGGEYPIPYGIKITDLIIQSSTFTDK